MPPRRGPRRRDHLASLFSGCRPPVTGRGAHVTDRVLVVPTGPVHRVFPCRLMGPSRRPPSRDERTVLARGRFWTPDLWVRCLPNLSPRTADLSSRPKRLDKSPMASSKAAPKGDRDLRPTERLKPCPYMCPRITMEEQPSSSGEAPKPAPKSKALWIVIAVVVVVVVVLLAAVLGGLFGPSEDRALKIGTVLSLTGTSGLEVFGPNNEKGVRLAVKEINAAGGVLGRPIELTSEDDQGVTTTARDRAQKLVTTNHVDAIIGAVGSGFCASVL